MIEAINFFQSLRIFGNVSNEKTNVSERRLSKALINDARKAVEIAETEAGLGREAKKLAVSAAEPALQRSLAPIAGWHYENAARFFRRAAARYAEASRLRTVHQKSLERRVEDFTALAREAEKNVRFLQSLGS